LSTEFTDITILLKLIAEQITKRHHHGSAM